MLTVGLMDILKIMRNIAKTVKENKGYLTELDSAIGDGDYGVNLERGFNAVEQKLLDDKSKDIGTVLENVGLTLMNSAGGAVGALYGTAFMKAGEAVKGRQKISLEDLVRMFKDVEQGIKEIGSAGLGEKTILDAIHPAVEALKRATEEGLSFVEVLERSTKAAKEGVENTKKMIAMRGRAKYLGDRTVGHQDVGATSFYLMLNSALEALREHSSAVGS